MAKPTEAKTDLDPRSTEVLLHRVGEGDHIPGAPDGTPPTDLTHNQVARLAYVHAYRETASDGRRPDPERPDPAVVAAVIDDLVASGHFSRTKPVAPADSPEV